MKLYCGLIWTLSQVSWALEGPQRVSASLGSSLSLQCKYRKGDEEAVKFWCREESPQFCSSSHLVRTTGSEAEMKVNKTSIKDNHTFHEFRITVENLTNVDAGAYLCGVERRRYDISHRVEVVVTAVSSSPSSDLVRNREQATEEPSGSTVAPERSQPCSVDFLLLVLKIPICLAMIAAAVWVHLWYNKRRSPKAKKHQNKTSSK